MVVTQEFPFNQIKLSENIFLREFQKDVLTEELVWHRDKNDRIVEVVRGKGWQLQMDNQLPVSLIEGFSYEIPANTYHRIKRGTTNLILKITEL